MSDIRKQPPKALHVRLLDGFVVKSRADDYEARYWEDNAAAAAVAAA